MISGQLKELKTVTLAKVFCENADDLGIIQERVLERPFREAYPDYK